MREEWREFLDNATDVVANTTKQIPNYWKAKLNADDIISGTQEPRRLPMAGRARFDAKYQFMQQIVDELDQTVKERIALKETVGFKQVAVTLRAMIQEAVERGEVEGGSAPKGSDGYVHDFLDNRGLSRKRAGSHENVYMAKDDPQVLAFEEDVVAWKKTAELPLMIGNPDETCWPWEEPGRYALALPGVGPNKNPHTAWCQVADPACPACPAWKNPDQPAGLRPCSAYAHER